MRRENTFVLCLGPVPRRREVFQMCGIFFSFVVFQGQISDIPLFKWLLTASFSRGMFYRPRVAPRGTTLTCPSLKSERRRYEFFLMVFFPDSGYVLQ